MGNIFSFFTIVLAILMFYGTAMAAPFLVCDPYPTTVTQPTHFNVTIVPLAPFDVPATRNPDNSVYLHYDLASITVGPHTASAKAVIIDPLWGRTESASSVPFVFSRPGSAGIPTGIAISQN